MVGDRRDLHDRQAPNGIGAPDTQAAGRPCSTWRRGRRDGHARADVGAGPHVIRSGGDHHDDGAGVRGVLRRALRRREPDRPDAGRWRVRARRHVHRRARPAPKSGGGGHTPAGSELLRSGRGGGPRQRPSPAARHVEVRHHPYDVRAHGRPARPRPGNARPGPPRRRSGPPRCWCRHLHGSTPAASAISRALSWSSASRST